MRKGLITFVLILNSCYLFSQSNNVNYVASFLDINTNARLTGFGEVGVVSSPFYNNSGVYQNPALISKHAYNVGADIFYMPWYSKLVDNSYFTGLAGFFAIDSSNAIALNFTYNSRGNITFIDEYGNYIESNNPYECYFKLGYNHSFNEHISTGIALKYFRSDIVPINTEVNIVNSVALDLGLNYDKKYQLNKQSFLNTSAGIDFTNLGPKISYFDGEEDFIPSKLAVGLFINPDIHLYKSLRLNIELGYQAEKYLIPTPPIYDLDGNIINGYDPNISSFKALFQSFYDAPDGFNEEIDEIMHKFGSEFRLNYSDFIYVAFRHGRHLGSETKGNGNYQTFGYGIGIYGFMLDFMKIKAEPNLPLDNIWAINLGLTINLEKGF